MSGACSFSFSHRTISFMSTANSGVLILDQWHNTSKVAKKFKWEICHCFIVNHILPSELENFDSCIHRGVNSKFFLNCCWLLIRKLWKTDLQKLVSLQPHLFSLTAPSDSFVFFGTILRNWEVLWNCYMTLYRVSTWHKLVCVFVSVTSK